VRWDVSKDATFGRVEKGKNDKNFHA